MSNIAVWTDGNDRVRRKHYRPDDVDTSGAHDVQEEGTPPDVEPWVSVKEHYNSDDGFYYETEDPFDGLAFTDSEKREIYDAVRDNDLVTIREVVETALNA